MVVATAGSGDSLRETRRGANPKEEMGSKEDHGPMKRGQKELLGGGSVTTSGLLVVQSHLVHEGGPREKVMVPESTE